MHKSLKTALCAMIFFVFSVSGQEPVTKIVGWQEASPEQKLEAEKSAEKALEQKLEEVEKRVEKAQEKLEEIQKGKKAKSVTEKVAVDDPSLTPREREIKLRAREIELREELKKLEEAQKRNDTSSERKARKMIEKREKQERKLSEEQAETYSRAQITGCPEGSVWVSPRVSERSRGRVLQVLTITNLSALNIDEIRAGDLGIAVRNLCSTGSITLGMMLHWEDSDQREITLTAIARPEDGGIATESTRIYLNRLDIQSQRMKNPEWKINLSRHYQTR